MRATGNESSGDQVNNEPYGTSSRAQEHATHETLGPKTSHPSQSIDWYEEYVARRAPLSMSWLPSPREVRGMGLLKKDDDTTLVTLMDDGSVCLRNAADGIGKSAGAGQIPGQGAGGQLYIPSGDAVDCVSIDQYNQKMYFAAHSVLTEVDLKTLKPSSRRFFPHQICSLSEGGAHPNPLTIGTTKSIHIYDPRDNGPWPSPSSSTDLVEGLTSIESTQASQYPDFQRLYSSGHSPSGTGRFAFIEPLPLSIVHLSHNIHVGGRFPSILTYDRRFFPQNMTSIYSGARISALIPFTYPGDSRDNLVAAGEYKTKGSLEIYPLAANDGSSSPVPEPVKNRVTASSSKLLSVIRHGTRILFSDSDGQLKWVERDGSALVRRWNINKWSVCNEARGGIFNASADEGDVARKLLALDQGERSEILVWTGEKVGIVGYGKTSRYAKQTTDGQEAEGSGDAGTASDDEKKFAGMMRRALERQADEVRFVQGLGLGM